MTNLTDTTVLVTGGAGEVGEGIVRQYLQSGATVIVPSRSPEKLADLRQRLAATEKLIPLVAEVGTEAGAKALRQKIEQQVGGLDAVVASLGGWWQGQPLTEISLERWHRLIDNSLTAHFIVARTFLPLIADRPGSSYTMINGAGGLHPVPTAGPISVSAAGQMMLQKVLAAEAQQAGQPVRINSLILATPVLTRSRPQGQPGWLTADEAGHYCVYLASEKGQAVSGQTIVFENRAQLPG
ncbi:MAG: SDR family oxidoreductase [Anaerolineae bacterium]|nr:SDR family oxidoreductase [Anaerolineae bacterium]